MWNHSQTKYHDAAAVAPAAPYDDNDENEDGVDDAC